MSFLYPLGFLGLIAIPLLILIYILRNKYRDETHSSTYIWELSEKYLRKKKPLNKVTGLLSLILQIIAVTFISISLAHPILVVPNQADNYCFILDASGSMNITKDGVTRFEKAKQNINDIVKNSKDGSTYTIILDDIETQTVLEKESDKQNVYQELKNLKAGYGVASIDKAVELAQDYYSSGKTSKTYLLTDKHIDEVENIEYIDLSTEDINYAVYDSSYSIIDKRIVCKGKIISYGSDANVTLNLYVDDELKFTKEYELYSDIEADYELSTNIADFTSLKVVVSNEDVLNLDNEDILYNINEENEAKILLVSEKPFYLNSIFKALKNNVVTNIKPVEYNDQKNYDIYIFDSYTPKAIPEEGTTWLINTSNNIENSGFVYQEEITLDQSKKITYSGEESTLYSQLTKGVRGNSIVFNKYQKYSLYRHFTTLMNYNNIPMIFAGTSNNGNREVVFSFDFHNSDFPLLYDFIILMKNLFNYSNPLPIERNYYSAGEELMVNVLDGCESIRLEAPSGELEFLDVDSTIATYVLKEIGTYKLSVTVDGTVTNYDLFVSFNTKESSPYEEKDKVYLVKNPVEEKNDGIFDHLYIVIIAGAVLFLLDWMVYAHEQY